MEVLVVSDSNSTARVAFVGKLDIQGAEAISLPLATLSGAKRNVVIDMSGVNFIASIGIRHLMSATKVLARRGGRLVLLKPTAPVLEVLQTSGITDLISVAASEDEVSVLVDGAAS
jgi:anti-sigma B factor antagonist